MTDVVLCSNATELEQFYVLSECPRSATTMWACSRHFAMGRHRSVPVTDAERAAHLAAALAYVAPWGVLAVSALLRPDAAGEEPATTTGFDVVERPVAPDGPRATGCDLAARAAAEDARVRLVVSIRDEAMEPGFPGQHATIVSRAYCLVVHEGLLLTRARLLTAMGPLRCRDLVVHIIPDEAFNPTPLPPDCAGVTSAGLWPFLEGVTAGDPRLVESTTNGTAFAENRAPRAGSLVVAAILRAVPTVRRLDLTWLPVRDIAELMRAVAQSAAARPRQISVTYTGPAREFFVLLSHPTPRCVFITGIEVCARNFDNDVCDFIRRLISATGQRRGPLLVPQFIDLADAELRCERAQKHLTKLFAAFPGLCAVNTRFGTWPRN